jgi:hypothetical protein
MTGVTPCHSCHHQLNPGARYCNRCGAAQHQASSAELAHTGPRVWLLVAGAVIAFGVLGAAIVTMVLISSSGASSVDTTAIPTVTAPSASAASSLPASSEKNSASTPALAGNERSSTAPTGILGLVPYRGANITAEIPSGWRMLEDETQKPGYIESKWGNPANSSDTLLIDTSPATRDTLEQDAAPVHEALLSSSGYQQLSYGPGNLVGIESWMWTFRISGDQRVDYFFNRCASGYAVLGSTVPSRFSQLMATFQEVAQSVRPSDASPC